MTTTRRTRRIAKVGSALIGLGLAATTAIGYSNAAFTATANPNGANNWATAGAVTLQSKFTTPMFSFGLNGAAQPRNNAGTLPFDGYMDTNGVTRDIDITYKGDVKADVRMYVSSKGTATNALDTKTLVSVTRDEDGPGGAAPVAIYSNVPLSDMPTTFATADSAPKRETAHWYATNTGGTSKVATYAVTVKLDAGAPTGSTVEGVAFQWEAQRDMR
jgi:hypothetical protein